ncbi:MAG TPA: WD40 repeat domain-containing protein [Polyangiaceae bacterium]|nr:WD40 repeat domain-containing protein [Polyangiaceae bacterium]
MAGESALSVRAPVGPETPWLGLQPFTESTTDYFFGRDEELTELFQRVVARPLTVLFGRSGLGKTSLLQAALIPRLRAAGFAPVLLRLDYADNALPLAAQLGAALGRAISEPAVSDVADSMAIWLLLHDPKFGVCSVPASGEVRRIVVIFDQFEEIFTLGQAKPHAAGSQQFLQLLADLVENRVPEELKPMLARDPELADRLHFSARPCTWLLSLRDDYLNQLERARRAMPSMMDNRMELRVLNGLQAFKATVEPGKIRCRGPAAPPAIVSDETGEAIVRFVAGVADDTPLTEIEAVPPLLSLLCAELNLRRRSAKQIKIEQLRGNAGDILSDFYQRCFKNQSDAVRDFVEQHLLSPEGFRQSVNHDTFVRGLLNARLSIEQAERSIAKLIENRLVVSEAREGIQRLELTHDILTGIVRTSREQREGLSRRERRRKRQVYWALLVAAICALAGAIAVPLSIKALRAEANARAEAVRAHQESEHAKRERERAERLLERAARADMIAADEHLDRPELALAYVARSLDYRVVSPSAVEQAVVLLSSSPNSAAVGVVGHADALSTAEFSPDGARVVTASWDRTARVWQTTTSKLLAELSGHSDAVMSAVFSPDGTRIVTASRDKTARIWEAASGKSLFELSGHSEPVRGALFSRDGTRVVTASSDNTARVWDATSGKSLVELKGHSAKVRSAVFNPDGTRVVTASWDKTARIWDAASGQSLFELRGHSAELTSAELSPDGALIATASEDATVRLWNSTSGKLAVELRGHSGAITSAVFSPDGSRVLSASKDKTARVWDTSSGKLQSVLLGHSAGLVSARFTSNGTRVVTASDDETARIWDTSSGKLLAELKGHSGPITSAAFGPDGALIVSASDDKTARLWNVASGKLPAALAGHSAKVTSVAFSPDWARLVTASEDKTARVWDAASGQLLVELKGHWGVGTNTSDGHFAPHASFSPDGTRVVTALGDGTARIWDATSGKLLLELKGHTARVSSVRFSSDGTRVATASWDQTARIWDATSGKSLLELKGHSANVMSIGFSPDGTRVVTASWDRTARIWDAASGKPLHALDDTAPLTAAAFSPDGTRVVTIPWEDNTAHVWDAVSGRSLAELTGHAAWVSTAVFSPDSARVLTGSWDQTARLWDAASGKSLRMFRGHSGVVNDLAFNAAGTRIVTASGDRTVRLWDVASGRHLAELDGHTDAVMSVAINPEGTRVATGSWDQTARIWQLLGSAPETPPPWFSQLLSVAACRAVAADGELVQLTGTDWVERHASVLASAERDPTRYGRIAAWYFGADK